MQVFHGTCARNAEAIERAGLRVGTYVTDDEALAEDFATVCRCRPQRCARGAVLTFRASRAEVDNTPDPHGFPVLGFITVHSVSPSRIGLVWC